MESVQVEGVSAWPEGRGLIPTLAQTEQTRVQAEQEWIRVAELALAYFQ